MFHEEPEWPPYRADEYFRSERFGEVTISIVRMLTQKYPAIDFSDAVATTFVWFERTGNENPDFLRSGRFPTEAAFRAYVRQALWNAARAAARSRASRKELVDPGDGSHLVSPEVSPAWLAAFHECRDRLPPGLQRILEFMHDENDPPNGLSRDEWAASVLGCTSDEVDRGYMRACDLIRICMGG